MRIGFALGSKPFYVNVERARVSEVVRPPDAIEQGLPTEDPPGVLHQDLEQLELLAREMDELSAHGDFEAFGIEPDPSSLEYTVRRQGSALGRAPSKNRLHPRRQLARTEGFGD